MAQTFYALPCQWAHGVDHLRLMSRVRSLSRTQVTYRCCDTRVQPAPTMHNNSPARNPSTVDAPSQRLHPDILKLGVVSFLTDLSSEMIFSVFAIYFTVVAGASAALLGLIEGLADLSASSLNYLSGWLSDRSGKRKMLTVAGYGFSTVAKGILLVSTSIAGLSIFRVVERLGKGFRGPARDAWLSSIAPAKSRGYAFGVHKAMDKAGAVLGPLVAYGLLTWLGESPQAYQTLFGVAVVPAVVALVVLAWVPEQPGIRHNRDSLGGNWHLLDADFKRFLLPAAVFALGYFSLGFLLLRAHDAGFSASQIVLLYALFNATCVLVAPLAGKLGDAVGRRHVVLLGYGLYGGLNLVLVFASSPAVIIGVFAVYGFFYAVEDSQTRALIADMEHERRATAMGVYNAITGALYLPASLVAGALWTLAPELAFGLAALLSLVAGGLLLRLPALGGPR